MKLHGMLNNYLPQNLRGISLGSKALVMTASLPYVSSVLVGMRQPAYVDEVISISDEIPVPDPEAFWFMER